MSTKNIVVIGASGAIGSAFVDSYAGQENTKVFAFSRSEKEFDLPNVQTGFIDFHDEHSVEIAAEATQEHGPLSAVIVAAGMLHDGGMVPEKCLKDISASKFEKLFLINAIGPALILRHFMSKMHKDERAIFASLSARVGSISDNQLGGWYAYRASKSALNMIIKTAGIEMARKHKKAILVGLHPGTVDSELSEPFQANVADGKLFTPEYSVSKMIDVMDGLQAKDTGKIFAWDGQEIDP